MNYLTSKVKSTARRLALQSSKVPPRPPARAMPLDVTPGCTLDLAAPSGRRKARRRRQQTERFRAGALPVASAQDTQHGYQGSPIVGTDGKSQSPVGLSLPLSTCHPGAKRGGREGFCAPFVPGVVVSRPHIFAVLLRHSHARVRNRHRNCGTRLRREETNERRVAGSFRPHELS